jgi:hypothetical protein
MIFCAINSGSPMPVAGSPMPVAGYLRTLDRKVPSSLDRGRRCAIPPPAETPVLLWCSSPNTQCSCETWRQEFFMLSKRPLYAYHGRRPRKLPGSSGPRGIALGLGMGGMRYPRPRNAQRIRATGFRLASGRFWDIIRAGLLIAAFRCPGRSRITAPASS